MFCLKIEFVECLKTYNSSFDIMEKNELANSYFIC